jgi:hypothetical protein
VVWWLERQLSSLAEQASDEACVHATGDAPRYAEALLQFASTAKNGNRWIGGVAMAQYKISYRIERVLGLRKAGSGVLSKAGWVAVCVIAIPALYASAAAQSLTRTELPSLSPAEIIGTIQQSLPLPAPTPVPAPIPNPVQEARPPQIPLTAPLPALAPIPLNPDLVGEIRLILSPVEQRQNPSPEQGRRTQFEQLQQFYDMQRRPALTSNDLKAVFNDLSAASGNSFVFALTGVRGRTLAFENSQGGTFSYGCPDCEFVVWETGVGGKGIAGSSSGIAFQLSSDGGAMTITCRATECRLASATGVPLQTRTLRNGETQRWPSLPQEGYLDPVNAGRTCFSVFGNVKADGTPFSAADCPGGLAVVPTSTLFFSVTR